jgi:ATP synthase F1 gamma subunit
MPTIQELREELDDITTLGFISSAFTEAAAARIQKIKDAFETNKQFYAEISSLYHLIRASSAKEKNVKDRKTGGEEGKAITVAITSNQRFYGNLNINIMHTLVEDIRDKKTDLMVVGTTGNDYMKSIAFPKPHQKRIFIKDNPANDEVHEFLDDVKKYETVTIYYPKFVTLMTQTVGKTDITQAASQGEKVGEEDINILFEPDLSEMLEFFARQVRALLFLRVVLESDLARTAARLLTMSSAEERSREMMKTKKSQLRKFQLSILNAKLLETFSAMKGWKSES